MSFGGNDSALKASQAREQSQAAQLKQQQQTRQQQQMDVLLRRRRAISAGAQPSVLASLNTTLGGQ